MRISEKGVRVFDVAVTAFGSYASDYTFNASNLVLEALPDILPLPPSTNAYVRILKYPKIFVTYANVTAAVNEVWTIPSVKWATNLAEIASQDSECSWSSSHPENIDLVLCLGQMRSFPGYSFEKLAHRDGYERKDLQNNAPESAPHPSEKDKHVEPRFFTNSEILYPGVDIEEIRANVQAAVPNTLIRASTEAGRFVCEYVLYSFLAELENTGDKTRQAIFMHVPAKDSEEDIRKGVEIARAYITAVMEHLQARNDSMTMAA